MVSAGLRTGFRLRWVCALALVFCLLAACGAMNVASAQAAIPVFDATHLREPHALDSTWLVHAGDDPAFALKDFDDSHWARFDPYKSISTVLGPDRPPIVWYRLHIKVDPAQTGLALNEYNLAHAFEVYANGERVMTTGRVSPFLSYTFAAHVLAPIPDRLVSSGALVIALRVYLSPSDWANGQNAGYYAYNLSIGQQTTLYRDNWLTLIGTNFLDWLDHALLILVGLVALALFTAQRRQREYLWIFIVGMLQLAQSIVPVLSTVHNIPSSFELVTALTRFVYPYIWVSLYFSFVHQRIGWRWRIVLILAGVTNAGSAIASLLLPLPLPVQLIGNLPFIVLLSVVIPIVLAIHWRRGNREAGILLIPVILFSLYIYAEVSVGTMFQFPATRDAAIRISNVIDHYPAGPFTVSLNDVSGILSSLSLALIMLLRSTRTSRRQAIMESELQAAQQVQQVLVPEQSIAVEGFTVQSVYQPAQQVGGDFFQLMPTGQGGLLLVIGDVAGKGLPAAMLVAVLVGAIRTVAQFTHDPAEILAELNDRMLGRAEGGFSTCLAAHLSADGLVTMANAGHLSPYLDGREVVMLGALPLGITGEARYTTMQFGIEVGSRLTFYSDGVVEAQNGKGELFGFERSAELSTRPAAEIVEAAARFGQQDDITVVTIERVPVMAEVA